MTSSIPNPPKIIGWVGDEPIWQVAGAGSPVIEVEADDADDDDGADDGPGPVTSKGEPDDWKPPTRAQWDRVQEAVRRNNRENGKLRGIKKRLAELGIEDIDTWLEERGIDPRTGGKFDPDGDEEDPDEPTTKGKARDKDKDEPDERPRRQISDATARRRVRQLEREVAQTEHKYKPVVAKLAARGALLEAGWSGDNIDRVMRLIDLDEVDVDEDGNVIGIQEQIGDIKGDFPEWFKAKRRTRVSVVEPEEDEPPVRRRRVAGSGSGRGTRALNGGEQQTDAQPQTWLDQVNSALS